jgi:hypothetical protein
MTMRGMKMATPERSWLHHQLNRSPNPDYLILDANLEEVFRQARRSA